MAGIVTINDHEFPFDFSFSGLFDLKAIKASEISPVVIPQLRNQLIIRLDFASYFIVRGPDDLINPQKVKDFWETQAFNAGTFVIEQGAALKQ